MHLKREREGWSDGQERKRDGDGREHVRERERWGESLR